MRKLIIYNWIVIAIAALFVGIYISIFENFIDDKAWLYFIVAILSGMLFYFQKRKI